MSKQVNEIIPRLFALAAKLEGEGQYNNAKLIRATAEAISRRAGYRLRMPSDKGELAEEIRNMIEIISDIDGIDDAFISVLHNSADALSEGRLPMIGETPHTYVCRICGHIILNQPESDCPTCQAKSGTFKRFLPVYWLEKFDPFETLKYLQQTPIEVSNLIKGLSEEEMTRMPKEGGWSLRNAIAHLRDAQGVFESRLELMLEQDNPMLESKAVFEWAENEADRPPTTQEIYDTYAASRNKVIAILNQLPVKDWWRKGQHEEFGTLTIKQQASYFATHELTHFPQINALRDQTS